MRLTPGEARRRLGASRVARLATVSASGAPHLVPVTFALDGDVIYTAVDAKPKTTSDLARIRNLRASPRAAVLADRYDEDWTALWWARADGEARIIDDPAAAASPLALLAARYAQYLTAPPPGPVIEIRVTRWSGWSAS